MSVSPGVRPDDPPPFSKKKKEKKREKMKPQTKKRVIKGEVNRVGGLIAQGEVNRVAAGRCSAKGGGKAGWLG